MPYFAPAPGLRRDTGIRARGPGPTGAGSPRSASHRRRPPATRLISTSLTVPPATLRMRLTSSRSRARPATVRVPVPPAAAVRACGTARGRAERAMAAPISSAWPTPWSREARIPGRLRRAEPAAGGSGSGRAGPRTGGPSSNRAAARARAASPSARAWWNLNRTAKEHGSGPARTCASQGGRSRSSGRAIRGPAAAHGSGVRARNTCRVASKSASDAQAAAPTGTSTSWIRRRRPGTRAQRALRSAAARVAASEPGPAPGPAPMPLPGRGSCARASKTARAPRCRGWPPDSIRQKARSSGERCSVTT